MGCGSLYRFCDILPLKNSHLCSTPEWLVPDRNDSLVTTCPRISCFQAQSSNNRFLRQYGLVYVICEIWILGKSYFYVYVLWKQNHNFLIVFCTNIYMSYYMFLCRPFFKNLDITNPNPNQRLLIYFSLNVTKRTKL